VAGPALAQERDVPTALVERAVPDLAAIEQRLRDRGVAEDRIGISMSRIRAAIASGKYPHLERRLYNFLHPYAGEDANRRRLADNDRRPDRERRERPERERPDRPVVDRPDVSRADEVRPDFDRPANTIAPVAPQVANARARVLTAPGIARRP
jgi:hypothetical protein